MMMSAYRQGRSRSQLDHLACVEMAASRVDVELITFALKNSKPTMVGLEDATAIIKPEEPGDEAFTFESLFDTCVTLRDYEAMKRHKVSTPGQLLPLLFETVLVFEVNFHPRVRLRLKAKDEHAARVRLPELMRPGEALFQRIVEEVAKRVFSSDDLALKTAGFLRIADPAPADAPEWEIVDPDAPAPEDAT